GRIVELGEIERVAEETDDLRAHTQREQLAALGLADGEDARGSLDEPSAEREVEDALGDAPALDQGRGPVRRQQIGNRRAGETARADRHRQVVAAVEMSDVEAPSVTMEELSEPDGHEEL